MKICIVTDEVSGDPETAIELGVGWGVTDFELRGVGTSRVPYLSEYQKESLQTALQAFSARIVALSPGLFKFPYEPETRSRFPVQAIDIGMYDGWKTSRERIKYHLNEVLPDSIELAKELGVDMIIAFSFDRAGQPPGEPPGEILRVFSDAARLVEAAGMQLAIEVEAGFWADTGHRSAQFINLVNHPCLRVNWDPGNALVAGDHPYPDGYGHVRDFVGHVHFKDVILTAAGRYEYAIDGQIDWPGQIAALIENGYRGYIAVETHMSPKVSAARAVLARLQSIIDQIPSQTD